MEILNRSNIFRAFLTLVSIFVFLSGEVKGQVAVTNPTNTTPNLTPTYTSLALAISALNAATSINGPVIITLTGNETAPSGGYVISAQGTATNTIIIQGSGSTITAPTPQPAGSLNDGIFKIIGGDFITIQNFTMRENPVNSENNQGTNNMTEWGVALLYATNTNGAKNNTIQNNAISLSSVYSNSVAVYSNVRHTAGTPLTQLEITVATGNNSNNKVYGNTINNVACPVVFVGSNNIAAMDSGNDIGGISAATGNTITAWGNNAANTGAFPFNAAPYTTTPTVLGIFCVNQLGLNIGYNTLTGNPLTTAIALRGIHVSGSPTAGTFSQTITNNTITLSNSAVSTYEVIKTEGMASLSTATININNNSILNCAVTGGFTGISNSSIPGGLNINSNIIRGTVSGNVNQDDYGIRNTGAASVYININNNQCGNASGNFIKYNNATSGPLTVISNEAATNACTLSITGNDIQGIDQSATAGSGSHIYINNYAASNLLTAKVQNLNTNTFTKINANTTGQITFINNSVSIPASGTQNVNGNSIRTSFSKTASPGTVYLYFSSSSVSATGTTILHSNNNFSNITLPGAAVMGGWRATGSAPASKTFSNNTFTNWKCGTGTTIVLDIGTGTYSITNNTITGIESNGDVRCIHTTTSAGSNATISKNTISAISSTKKTVIVTGIYSEAPTATISKNKIYDISNNNISRVAISGIFINSTGTVTLSNNYVGDIWAPWPDWDHALMGIYVNRANVFNAYNNTVWLNCQTRNEAAFGSSALYIIQAGKTNLFNNIFVNISTAKNIGDIGAYSVAYRRRSSITVDNYTGNNNLFYAGTPGYNNRIYLDSNSNVLPKYISYDLTLAEFKRRLGTIVGIPAANAENASITEYPPFVSTVGTDPQFLHINGACVSPPTYIESGGKVISGITDDFDGDLRWGESGYFPSGLGAAPDIGADEFNSQSIVVTSSAGLTTPTSYNTLKAAFARINNGTHKGAIIMKLYCSTVEKGIAVLNATGSGGASYSEITIYPAVQGLSISSSADSAIIDLNGATNLTIDGRVNLAGQADLSIIHAGTNMASRNILFRNSAQNNTIKYCRINGSCPDPVSGVIYFSPSTSTPGNVNNLIERCEFSNSGIRPLNVIFSDGADGRVNSNNTISNNTFYNFLNPASASNGIFIRDFSTTWSIVGNSFYENTSLSPTVLVEYSAIRIQNNTGNDFTISGNYIGGSAGQCTGDPFTKINTYSNTFYGIYFNVSSATTSSIQGNTIRNFSWSNPGAANWTGIYIGGGIVNIGNVTGNTIGSATGTGSIFVRNGYLLNVDVVGIRHESSGTGIIRNNIIGSITTDHSSPNSTSIFGIYKSSGTGVVTISDNSIGSAISLNSINATSVSTDNAQLVYGICNTTSAACTISGNTIGNLTNAGSNTGSVAGISLLGSSTNIVSKNFIHSLKSITPTVPIYGINVAAGTGTYSNNIVSLGTTVTSGSAIYGISENTTAESKVYFNTVYIGGAVTGGTNNTWGINSGNSNTRDFRDNIFFNNRSGGGTHYAIGLANKTGLTINYNNYYSTSSILGQFNGTDQTTIAAWKIATSPQDVNSVNLDPVFPGAGGTVESGYLPAVALSGITIPTFTTDYNSVNRATPPTMGALESVAIATTSLSPSTVCTNNTLDVCFNSTGTFAPGNVFKAQLSDASGSFAFLTPLEPGLTSSASGNQCFNVLVPTGISAGSGYRIRVVSSSPANTNDAGIIIDIHQSSTLTATKTDVTCSGLPIGAIDLTVTGGTPTFNYLWTTLDGVIPVGQSTNPDLTGLVAGTYKVTMSGNFGCVSTLSVPIVVSTLPAVPALTATLPCVGNSNTTFTAGNGSKYQFFFNGFSQGSPSATNTFTRTSTLIDNDMVCVRSFWPLLFDGIMDEPSWGAPLATSAGGPNPSGFGADNHIDAIYIKSDPDYIFGGIAGSLGNNSGNKLLLFIDCQSAIGNNSLNDWVTRTSVPSNSMGKLNNGILFDSNFEPEYILSMDQLSGDVNYHLYNMLTNTNNPLGTSNIDPLLGFTANSGYGDNTKGFEFAISRSALGNPVGPIKVFAMIVDDGAGVNTTLSNQFLTKASSAEGNYGNGAIDFGSRLPDPISITLSDIDCYSQTCITIKTVTPPVADNITVCYDGLPHTATASTAGASIKYYTTSGSTTITTAPTGTAFGTYSAWAEATDSISLCVSTRTEVILTIKERPVVNPVSNRRYCKNESAPSIPFTATPTGGTFTWTSSSDIGFGTVGIGDLPVYTAANNTNAPVLAVINVSVTAVNGCTSLPRAFNDTVFPTPIVNTITNKAYCNGDAAPAIYFSSLTSGTIHYNWSTDNDIGASGVDSIVFAPVNSTIDPIVSTVTVSASANGCTGPNTSFTITINPTPVPVIVPDYCSVPNKLVLTVQPRNLAAYLWNTSTSVPGYNTDSIVVDQAGNFGLVVTNSGGCQGSAYLNLGTELVKDGSFTNFLPSAPPFFSEYKQNPFPYNGYSDATGLIQANKYAVDINAWSNQPLYPIPAIPINKGYHRNFYGRDHTNNTVGPRNFMMVNGSDSLVSSPPPTHPAIIWQQTVDVKYRRNYYFSAWAMNLSTDNNAILRFEINGELAGTTLNLNTAPKPSSDAQVNLSNWRRFFNETLWTPKNANDTIAVIRIVNLNTAFDGNNFGLDDISFGVLASLPDASSATANGGGTVCVGDDLNFTVDSLHGGTLPYSYEWKDPVNSIISTSQTAFIADAQVSNNGNYTLVVTDANGCKSTPAITNVNVIPFPVAPTAALADRNSICNGDGGRINLSVAGGSGTRVRWFANDCDIPGSNLGIVVPPDQLNIAPPLVTTTYYARWETGCDSSECKPVTVTVGSVWTGNVNTDWNNAGNWSGTCGVPDAAKDAIIPNVPIKPVVNITGAACKNLTIDASATLDIIAGQSLTINSNLINNGALTVSSAALNNNGSLIVLGASSGSGTIAYNRFLETNRWFITSPSLNNSFALTNGSNIGQVGSTFNIAPYTESNNDGWAYLPAIPATLSEGVGYLVKLSAGNMVKFSGTLNDDISISVPSSGPDDGWNAIGNPYTSALRIVDELPNQGFITQNTTTLDPNYQAVYVWNETGPPDQYYKVICNVGYTGKQYGGILPDKYIQAGQGFLVNIKYNGGAPGTIKFNHGTSLITGGMQVHSPATTTLKSSETNTSWPGITLLASGNGKTVSTVVAFNSNMTTGLDPSYDAGMLSATDFNLYTHLVDGSNQTNFMVQCLPDTWNDTFAVPIGIDLPTAGLLTFKAADVILPDGLYPVIEDRLLQLSVPLKTETDSLIVGLAEPTWGTGRFYLHIGGELTTVGNSDTYDSPKLSAYFDDQKIIVLGLPEKGSRAWLCDMSGRILGSEYRLTSANRNEISAKGLSSGIYLLRIEGKAGLQTIKITVVNR